MTIDSLNRAELKELERCRKLDKIDCKSIREGFAIIQIKLMIPYHPPGKRLLKKKIKSTVSASIYYIKKSRKINKLLKKIKKEIKYGK